MARKRKVEGALRLPTQAERAEELRSLRDIAVADAKATRRALDRMIALVRTKYGAQACCYRGLSADKLRAWAYGRAKRPAL